MARRPVQICSTVSINIGTNISVNDAVERGSGRSARDGFRLSQSRGAMAFEHRNPRQNATRMTIDPRRITRPGTLVIDVAADTVSTTCADAAQMVKKWFK